MGGPTFSNGHKTFISFSSFFKKVDDAITNWNETAMASSGSMLVLFLHSLIEKKKINYFLLLFYFEKKKEKNQF